MRVLLICHHDAELHREGVARWIASWSSLCGILVVREPRGSLVRRARRELRRVGTAGMLDVAAFRGYYRFALARGDASWRASRLADLRQRFAPIPGDVQACTVASPNSAEAERFVRDSEPDLVIALCKNILAERIFSLPPLGTFVLHPGICPEYRNAHGCFWALVRRDLDNVGLTLLRIDRGVDTGPVFGYFRAPYDEQCESHCVIQDRMLLDNLDAIRDCFRGIGSASARPLSVAGRTSAVWGQPRFTSYLRWKRATRHAARLEQATALTE
jgi:hypothetical protein